MSCHTAEINTSYHSGEGGNQSFCGPIDYRSLLQSATAHGKHSFNHGLPPQAVVDMHRAAPQYAGMYIDLHQTGTRIRFYQHHEGRRPMEVRAEFVERAAQRGQGDKGYPDSWYSAQEGVQQLIGHIAQRTIKGHPEPWDGAYEWYRDICTTLLERIYRLRGSHPDETELAGVVSDTLELHRQLSGDSEPIDPEPLGAAAAGIALALILAAHPKTRRLASVAFLATSIACSPVSGSMNEIQHHPGAVGTVVWRERSTGKLVTVFALSEDHRSFIVDSAGSKRVPRQSLIMRGVGVNFADVDAKYKDFENSVVVTVPTTSVDLIEGAARNTPLRGMGKFIYEQGVENGIDPTAVATIVLREYNDPARRPQGTGSAFWERKIREIYQKIIQKVSGGMLTIDEILRADGFDNTYIVNAKLLAQALRGADYRIRLQPRAMSVTQSKNKNEGRPLPSGILLDFPMTIQRWEHVIVPVASLFDHDPRVIAQFIEIESQGIATATSRSGARGLAQIMPTTYIGLLSRAQTEPRYRQIAQAAGFSFTTAAPYDPLTGVFLMNIYLDGYLPKGRIPSDPASLEHYVQQTENAGWLYHDGPHAKKISEPAARYRALLRSITTTIGRGGNPYGLLKHVR